MNNKKDETEEIVDFLLPLFKEGLGKAYIGYLKEAMLDVKSFTDEFAENITYDGESRYGKQFTFFKIAQIICSYYTLNVSIDKRVYWESCLTRKTFDVAKGNSVDDEITPKVTDALSKLNDEQQLHFMLKNVHRASDKQIAHILNIPHKKVATHYEKGMESLQKELAKIGVEVDLGE